MVLHHNGNWKLCLKHNFDAAKVLLWFDMLPIYRVITKIIRRLAHQHVLQTPINFQRVVLTMYFDGPCSCMKHVGSVACCSTRLQGFGRLTDQPQDALLNSSTQPEGKGAMLQFEVLKSSGVLMSLFDINETTS